MKPEHLRLSLICIVLAIAFSSCKNNEEKTANVTDCTPNCLNLSACNNTPCEEDPCRTAILDCHRIDPDTFYAIIERYSRIGKHVSPDTIAAMVRTAECSSAIVFDGNHKMSYTNSDIHVVEPIAARCYHAGLFKALLSQHPRPIGFYFFKGEKRNGDYDIVFGVTYENRADEYYDLSEPPIREAE